MYDVSCNVAVNGIINAWPINKEPGFFWLFYALMAVFCRVILFVIIYWKLFYLMVL